MSDKVDLQRRVEVLEGEVRDLRRLVFELSADGTSEVAEPAPQPVAEPTPPPVVRPAPAPTTAAPPVRDAADFTTGIIAKIGMGLLLLGVAFLLKYSYDQGWLTETMRVLMGAATGAALLGGGIHQRHDNQTLSAVLLGGAIVCFYGSAFAAYRLYDLIPWAVAIACMVGTTMGAFVLAVREESPVLGSIAAIGGLATPFALSADSGNLELLAVYSSIVLLGTGAIYLMRGWVSLLTTATAGGIAVVTALVLSLGSDAPATQQGLAIAAVLVLVFVNAVMPALRVQMRDESLGEFETVIALVVPMVALSLFGYIVDGATVPHAALVAGLAIGFFALHHLTKDDAVAPGLTASALTIAALGIAAGVIPEAMALIVLAGAAHAVADRSEQSLLRVLGYGALLPLGLWTTVLLFEGATEPAFLNPAGLQMIGAVAALVIVARSFEATATRWAHYYVASLAGMLTVVSQLSDVAGGDAIATASWGLFALVLLVWSLLRDHTMALVLGVAAILLTAAKLLLFDLDGVDAIWRVALFMGFGIAMLYISYMVPRWTRRARESDASDQQ